LGQAIIYGVDAGAVSSISWLGAVYSGNIGNSGN